MKQVENIVGKKRNCSLQAISPFSTVFSKYLYCKHVKTRNCLLAKQNQSVENAGVAFVKLTSDF